MQASQTGAASGGTRVVIVGGGTAGWMTASALATLMGGAVDIHLVESEEIGIVGVGEATLPHLRAFLERIGADEAAFMAATHATYKLGIQFDGFGCEGQSYIHPFGTYGRPLAGVGFHHFWLRARAEGHAARIDEYSLAVMAAEARRFARPQPDAAQVDSFGYAYQFDATLFGPYLRGIAEPRGVTRTEGRVASVERDAETGDVRALLLADGQRIEGDLFIDCSGFRALLIGDEAWEDWSHWLPCDRAVAVPCRAADAGIEPFTRATAMPAGWRWHIPLRHRVGNGYVYSSAHCSDEEAASALLAAIEGEALAEPRLLRFRAGRRRRSWVGNVVSVGLASGLLEPLESTSIYLIQMAITGLVEHFPGRGIDPIERDAFNREVDYEYDRIRDFLILHYHATERRDSSFWNHVRTMDIPDTLAEKLELWRSAALVPQYRRGLFLEPSWISVLVGQGVLPEGWDVRAELPESGGLAAALRGLHTHIASRVAAMPPHHAALGARAAP
ncbi:tryptophan 7-halogenase [Sphingobium amiense]|uniref:Tryptophan 7-halogenase n=1 Tax=Sphingobium amiense TaxID=135719 RepID=A0A494W975_9SPHN|nr:tryptophan halogenase family protein [Sphingobium amiense]BBD96749.1 tryptophan 7-halogenase [Sphingobium amiense]